MHPKNQQSQVATLQTQRLTIRPLQESDIPAVQRNFEDWETVRFLTSAVPWPYPPNGAMQWYRDVVVPGQGITNWSWAICLKESPEQLVGVIELFRDRASHRGFWLDRNFRGNGYMEEAARAVNEHAFTVLGFEKLNFDNAMGNIPSRRIKEKTGAKLIGVRPASLVDTTIKEMEHWELTKEAWLANR
jgi:RimJ/RimL family protein N-acetyltransferase